MRIEYIREMKRSYMTVTGEGVGESYETGMLAKNQISGLLKMKIKYMDGVPVYCYDITSRQPVSRLFESRPVHLLLSLVFWTRTACSAVWDTNAKSAS